MEELAALADGLDGVRRTASAELACWRWGGRLVARQLDRTRVVIRTDFDSRDALLRDFPDSFSVPRRFAKHMMVVVDLSTADTGAVEDALLAAWELQVTSFRIDEAPDREHP